MRRAIASLLKRKNGLGVRLPAQGPWSGQVPCQICFLPQKVGTVLFPPTRTPCDGGNPYDKQLYVIVSAFCKASLSI